MKTPAALATALAAAALIVTPGLAQARPDAKAPDKEGEAKLAKMLEGRVAGEPVSCIPVSQTTNTTVIKNTAIVYRVGSTLYVNRPNNADQLDGDDILVTKLYGSQLCSVDTIELRDRNTSFMWNGFVSLNKFVPYRKGKAAH